MYVCVLLFELNKHGVYRGTRGNIRCVCVIYRGILETHNSYMCVKHCFLIHTCIYIWRYYVIDDRPTVVEKNVIFYTPAKIFSFVSTVLPASVNLNY